ncbi:MAG: glutamate-5-semialdehyde dehydrogenase [Candidatus Omnitrophota bacterium]
MRDYVRDIVKKAKQSSYAFNGLSAKQKNKVLLKMADYLTANKKFILKENEKDIEKALKAKLKKSFIDRLTLNEKRLKDMSVSLKEIARLKGPIGTIIAEWKRPNGLNVSKVRVPIGVILVVYEARPNVTSDCIGLLFKTSNVGILKGGKDSINSNIAIAKILKKAAKDSGINFAPFFVIEDTSRKIVDLLLKENEYIDLVIPRGGEALIRKVVKSSRIPVIKHYKGICHIYVDKEADLNKSLKICINAKVQRPSVCNAVETILVHEDRAAEFLPKLKREFDKYEVEIRAGLKAAKIIKGVKKAVEKDWFTEYLDLIVSVKVVRDIDEAIAHINHYGSSHTDSIITENPAKADKFVKEVDSACCFINISTRFSDGYQFGLGAEIGISTDKIHARGPMGLEELTIYKWIAAGNGQTRE